MTPPKKKNQTQVERNCALCGKPVPPDEQVRINNCFICNDPLECTPQRREAWYAARRFAEDRL